jgi:hypothetical protein
MPKLKSLRLGLAFFLICVGLAFACLPDEWIEDWLGFSPDNGNGLAEAAFAAAPLALGCLLAADFLVARVRRFIAEPMSKLFARNR